MTMSQDMKNKLVLAMEEALTHSSILGLYECYIFGRMRRLPTECL